MISSAKNTATKTQSPDSQPQQANWLRTRELRRVFRALVRMMFDFRIDWAVLRVAHEDQRNRRARECHDKSQSVSTGGEVLSRPSEAEGHD